MKFNFAFLLVLPLALLAGCGGGGGGGSEIVVPPVETVSNAQFRVVWPTRSRDAMKVTLTSASSARLVLPGAAADGSDVTVNIDRDPAKVTGYTGTYTISQGVNPKVVGGLTATFYSEAGEGGSVVGTATTTATISGTQIDFTPITLTGKITQVVAPPATLTILTPDTQLNCTAMDESNNVVAVAPGAAIWAIIDGDAFCGVQTSGLAKPRGPGIAHFRVRVDSAISAPIPITVIRPPTPAFGYRSGPLVTPTSAGVEGVLFQVVGDSQLLVTSLGYQFRSADQAPGVAALFDGDGNVLVSATISNSDALQDGYYYKDITPIVLHGGQKYYIGAWHGAGDSGAYLSGDGYPLDGSIHWFGPRRKVSPTIEGGTWSTKDSTPDHMVANFKERPIP